MVKRARACAAIALVVLVGCEVESDAVPKTPASGAIPVRTLVLVASERAPTTTLAGTLVADLEVALRPEATGVVEVVRFVDGQAVRKGQILLELRDAEARARLDEADATLKLAETEIARTEALASREHASQSAVDTARASRDLAIARRKAAAELLRRTVLRAPFDGRVGTRDVAPGDTVDPSRVVTTLVDVDPLRAEIEVPERLSGWLRPGLQASVVIDAVRVEPIAATVDFVAPRVEPASRTVRVRAGLEGPLDGLRPGMTAEVTLTLDAGTSVLRVPSEAVLTRSDGAVVWVVAGGKAQTRPIAVGERLVDDVVVTNGLSPGDEVVVQGIARLRPGVEVSVLGPADDARAEAE